MAHAAYRESGGMASVSIALWSPDGSCPGDMEAWKAAAAAAPTPPAEMIVREALLGPSVTDSARVVLLSQIPAAHTSDELTALLEASSDPLAAEFLAARNQKDKAKQKELKADMVAGKWEPLMTSLSAQVDSSPPFSYPNFPMLVVGEEASGCVATPLIGHDGYLCSIEFLHFDIQPRPPAAAEDEAAALVAVAPEAGGLRAGGV